MNEQARRMQAREIRDRCHVIRQVLDDLPEAVVAAKVKLTPGTDKTHVLRGLQGQLYAQFWRRDLGQFLLDAAQNLQLFTAYIEQLEAEAYDVRTQLREERDMSRSVFGKLDAARAAGLNTAEGRRLLHQAASAARTS